MLHTHSIINEDTVKCLKALLDFSHIVVKDLQRINIDTLKQDVDKLLIDFIAFLNRSKN